MKKRGFASFAAALAMLITRAASAQPQYTAQSDSPQWLKDRRYNEGAGIRAGDLELHPGIAGEFGYDSNYLLRSTQSGVDNGPPTAPPIPALEFRLTPSLYVSTLSGQRREGDLVRSAPPVAFRGGVNFTYWELIGISSDPAASAAQNDLSKDRDVSGAADARLDILPERPFGASVFASYSRVAQPSTTSADPNFSFDRDNVGAGAELVVQPGGGTLDWRFGYQFSDILFENSDGAGFDNLTHEASTRGRWKFRPRTSLVYDATLRFISYTNESQAQQNGLVNSMPLRARLGLNGLISDRFAATVLAGYGASFYDHALNPPQYDSVIGQAELKWFLAASPGIANATDLGLTLSSLALGYTRDFQNSYLGNYYGSDRGYLKFYYFFAGRALATLEGGVGAVEYPKIQNFTGTPAIRHAPFTDVRADVTLFSEYRFTDSFGLNGTFRYTQNFSNAEILEPAPSTGLFAMSWQRIEAYLGVRWFM